ncbi:MAG: murein transglycosylase [Gemmatimonadetes bacterium]|nr:MAG: murein transglycosylase [Gemmatimonadota bacterium]
MHTMRVAHRWLRLQTRVWGRRPAAARLARGGLLAASVGCLWFGLHLAGERDQLRHALEADPVVPAAMADLQAELGPMLPVEVNERVEYWMRRFRTDQKEVFEDLLAREGLYGDMIRRKLRERGMPEGLVYLAMIESGFSTRARSRAEAIGMWQFMVPTARQYGLRIDEWVDERRDPERATDAALDYLQALHERYGSWYLAAAAYNAGPTRVSRALRRHAGAVKGDEELYWEIIDHLPRETALYVPKFLAATYLARRTESERFVFDRVEPFRYQVVWVPGGTRLSVVARRLGAEGRVLRDLNPQLLRGVTPPGEVYPLRVPAGSAPRVVAALARTDAGARRAD